MSDPSKPAPNLLLIVGEDHGPHLGCYGDATATTPHLDALAARGVRFDHHYTTQAVCSPGRASILTGLYPHQNGQIALATHKYAMYEPFDNLASLLKGQGYRTGIVGKLHVNPEDAFPFDFRWNDPKFISFNNRDVRKTADVCGSFIRDTPVDEPFFLYVNYSDAHLPLLKQSFGEPAEPLTGDDVPAMDFTGVDTPSQRAHAADYYNCMNRLDTGIGLLLEELRASGRAENTLVVFTADHGLQFSRGKVSCYEPGLRVPLIIHDPRKNAGHLGGSVCEELTSHVDILPTVLEALDLPDECLNQTARARLSGASLAPLCRGESTRWRKTLCCEWQAAGVTTYFPQRTVRDDRFKLIVSLLDRRPHPGAENYQGGPDSHRFYETGVTRTEWEAAPAHVRAAYECFLNPPEVELYDLREDPFEFENLAERPEHHATVERLRAALADWQRATHDRLADPAALDKLTAEHDAIAAAYYQDSAWGSSRDFTWSYADYLHA